MTFKKHLMAHAEQPKHTCSDCSPPINFYYSSELLTHKFKKKHKEKSDKLKCGQCNKYLTSQSNLKRHMATHKPNIFPCFAHLKSCSEMKRPSRATSASALHIKNFRQNVISVRSFSKGDRPSRSIHLSNILKLRVR